jgi:hypothetical protein
MTTAGYSEPWLLWIVAVEDTIQSGPAAHIPSNAT